MIMIVDGVSIYNNNIMYCSSNTLAKYCVCAWAISGSIFVVSATYIYEVP